MKHEKMEIAKTRKGHKAIWESGGGYTNTGYSIIIADKDGNKKPAIFIKTSGELACKEHALIPIQKDDVVINMSRHHDDYELEISKIIDFDKEVYYWEICPKCGYKSAIGHIKNGHRKCYNCNFLDSEDADWQSSEIRVVKYYAILEPIWDSENSSDYYNFPEKFREAADAAMEKSNDYHCRTPYYISNY